MTAPEYLHAWDVPDPSDVQAAEYRAIFDLLEDALSGADEDVADDPQDFVVAILGEVIGYAKQLRKKIKAFKPVCAGCRATLASRRGVVQAKGGALFHGRCWNTK